MKMKRFLISLIIFNILALIFLILVLMNIVRINNVNSVPWDNNQYTHLN